MHVKYHIALLLMAGLFGSSTVASAQETNTGPTDAGEAPPNVEHLMRPEGPVTPFAELIAEGLDTHPAVLRRRAEVQVEKERLSGVGLIPDPTVRLAAEAIPWNDPGLSSSPMSGISLGVSQPLWWPGELDALKEEVSAKAAALEPLVDEEQVDLLIDASRLYYELYQIDRTIEALQKLKPPLNEFIRLLKARISTGKASVAQVERVRLQLLRVDDEIFMLMHQRPEKVAKLNALLNRPAGSQVNPPKEAGVGEMQQMTGEPLDRLDELVERGMANRPIVEAMKRRKQAALAQARSAKWENYPDLAVFGSWRFRAAQDNGLDDGTDFVSLGVKSSIPVWSDAKASSADDVAQAKLISLDSAIAAFRLKLRGEIAGHLAELHHLHKHVAYYRDELIPQAKQARRAALAGFRAGRANYEDWIQAEERLVELQAKLAKLSSGIRMHRALILALIAEVPRPGADRTAATEAPAKPQDGPSEDGTPAEGKE